MPDAVLIASGYTATAAAHSSLRGRLSTATAADGVALGCVVGSSNKDKEHNSSVSSTQSQVGQDANTSKATNDCRAAADNHTQRTCIEKE